MGGCQSSPKGSTPNEPAAPPGTQIPCANGHLQVGSRVQTQYEVREGGNGRWYSGSITRVYPSSGCATIRYDDGDMWTGTANPDIFLLPGQPGLQAAASALPVVEVPVIQEGQPCAPAVTAVPVGAPVDGGGIPVAQPVVVPAEAVVVRGY